MKRLFLLGAISYLLTWNVQAQSGNYSLSDDGITWHYVKDYEAVNPSKRWEWQAVSQDTVIGKHTYKKVYSYDSESNDFTKSKFKGINVFRQEGRKILVPDYPKSLEQIGDEYLSYDFSLQKGDLWGAQTNEDNTYIVKKVENKTYNGREFKTLYLENKGNGTTYIWVENVGAIYQNFFNPCCILATGRFTKFLIDLSYQGKSLFYNPETGIETVEKSKPVLSVAQTNGSVRFTLESDLLGDANLQIYSTDGRKLSEYSLTPYSARIIALPQGNYLYNLNAESKTIENGKFNVQN